jgi:hypothetical protein
MYCHALGVILGTIQESLQEKEAASEPRPAGAAATPVRPRHSLQPKGSCWYCDKPVDNVRRFCGKECADAFDEEAEYNADAAADPER